MLPRSHKTIKKEESLNAYFDDDWESLSIFNEYSEGTRIGWMTWFVWAKDGGETLENDGISEAVIQKDQLVVFDLNLCCPCYSHCWTRKLNWFLVDSQQTIMDHRHVRKRANGCSSGNEPVLIVENHMLLGSTKALAILSLSPCRSGPLLAHCNLYCWCWSLVPFPLWIEQQKTSLSCHHHHSLHHRCASTHLSIDSHPKRDSDTHKHHQTSIFSP